MIKAKVKKLPSNILKLIYLAQSIADEMNCPAYLVGGFARDLLLARGNFDLDIVVEADGIQFAQKLADKTGGHVVRHHQFGTATIVLEDKSKIDIATARKETYSRPGALPEVVGCSIRDDLARRDFTINALAIKINKDGFLELVDCFGGQADLKNKKIRVLHDLSFIDDPTRILRAVRFQQRYKFGWDRHTYKLMKNAVNQDMLNAVSKHRIRDELILLLKEPEAIRYILYLEKTCGLDFIHPKLRIYRKTIDLLFAVDRTVSWFENNFSHRRCPETWLMYLAAILDSLKFKELKNVLSKFAFRRGEEIRILSFKKMGLRTEKDLEKKRLKPSRIYQLLEPLSYEVILLINAKTHKKEVKSRIKDFFSIYNGVRLGITGKDLKGLGLLSGPHFKRILNKVLYKKLDGNLQNKHQELEYLKKILKSHDYRHFKNISAHTV